MKSKTILVTGAGGFIGSWVVRKLYTKYKVIAVVSPFSKSKRLDGIKDKIIIVKIDLASKKAVENLLKKYRPFAVLHLATHGVYTYQQEDIDRIVIDNYLMTSNLLSSSVKYGVKKFINTGSVFEYGSQKRKVKESDVNLDDILNKYSAVKMATTALTNSYSDKLNVITLRPFTTFGPDEDPTRFVRATIDRALKNDPIRLVKNVIRDFVYVSDVADAFIKCVNKNFVSGEIVSIASGKKSTLDIVAKLIKKITKSESKIIYDNSYIRKKESACWADITRAKKVLNWSPKHTLLQGIKKMVYSLEDDK